MPAAELLQDLRCALHEGLVVDEPPVVRPLVRLVGGVEDVREQLAQRELAVPLALGAVRGALAHVVVVALLRDGAGAATTGLLVVGRRGISNGVDRSCMPRTRSLFESRRSSQRSASASEMLDSLTSRGRPGIEWSTLTRWR